MKNVILTGIHRGKGSKSDTVYAQLREEAADPKTGLHELVISATLHHILQVSLERKYVITNLLVALGENSDLILGPNAHMNW